MEKKVLPPSIDEQSKQKIINLIIALQPQAKIYLFGSQATGHNIHGSDIDIALITPTPLKRAAIGEIREVLNATDIPSKFDIVDFNAVSEKMQSMILKEGILWKN